MSLESYNQLITKLAVGFDQRSSEQKINFLGLLVKQPFIQRNNIHLHRNTVDMQ